MSNSPPTPLVSIVIPCFNSASVLGDTIRSALAQTYSRIEVIVVDDGSTDTTRDVIKEFGDQIVSEFTPNRGACAARNRGIQLANGEYVQFLDSDDLMTPDCILRKLEFLSSPEVVSCCNVRLMMAPNDSNETEAWDFAYDLVGMLARGAPQTSVPLHRRELLEKIGGFREHLPCAQDYDLHLRLRIVCGIEFKPNGHVGVLIRPVSNSLSRSAGIRMPNAKLDVLEEASRLLKEQGEFNDQCREAVAIHVLAIARTLWKFGDREQARLVAQRAVQISESCFAGCYSTRLQQTLAQILGFSLYETLIGAVRRIRRRDN